MPRKKKEAKPPNEMGLTDREQIIFKLLRTRKVASAEDILSELRAGKLRLKAKRDTHSLAVLMKYLAAKACQEGWIVSMVGGGQGAYRKASYQMEKRF